MKNPELFHSDDNLPINSFLGLKKKSLQRDFGYQTDNLLSGSSSSSFDFGGSDSGDRSWQIFKNY